MALAQLAAMVCLRSIGGGVLLLSALLLLTAPSWTGGYAHAQATPAAPTYPQLPAPDAAESPDAREHPEAAPQGHDDYTWPEPLPPAPTRPRGTHFFLEAHLGVASSPLGPSGGLLFGAGGKLPRSPFRFYFLTELGASQRGGPDSLGGGQMLWVGPGVRTYVPLAPRLRLFADMTAGAVYLRDELIARRAGLSLSRWRAQLTVAAGLQLRVLRELSIGMRVAYMIVGEDELQSSLTERSGWTFTGSATWHF